MLKGGLFWGNWTTMDVHNRERTLYCNQCYKA
jgi:hypothetical protein